MLFRAEGNNQNHKSYLHNGGMRTLPEYHHQRDTINDIETKRNILQLPSNSNSNTDDDIDDNTWKKDTDKPESLPTPGIVFLIDCNQF